MTRRVGNRRVAGGLIVLLALVWSALAERPEQMDFADGLFSRGLYDMAAAEYESMLEENPSFDGKDAALFRLAECRRNLGDKAGAERSYAQLMGEFPDSAYRFRGEFRRAELFLAGRQYQDAVRLFQALLAAQPPEDIAASTHYFLGYALEKLEKTDEAEAAYRQVVDGFQQTSYFSYACLALAQLMEKQGRSGEEIRELYSRAGTDSATPRVAAEALFLQGESAFRAGNYAASAEAYGRLLEEFPADRRAGEARLQAAWSFYHAGNVEQAEALCTEALADAETKLRPDWMYVRANCLRKLDRAREAVEVYDRLIKGERSDATAQAARYERLLVLYDLGEYEKVLESGSQLDVPDDMVEDAIWLLAESASKLNRADEALNWLARAIAGYPNGDRAPLAVFRRARLLQDAGKLSEAITGYQYLVEKYGESPLVADALFASAFCHLSEENHEAALADLDRILESHSSFPQREDVLYQKVLAQLKLARDAEARKTLRTLVSDFPDGKHSLEAQYWSGILAERADALTVAEKHFRAVVRQDGENPYREKAMFRLSAVLQKRDEPVKAANLLVELLDTSMVDEMPSSLLEWLARVLMEETRMADAGKAAALLVEQGDTPVWRQIGHYLVGACAAAEGNEDSARRAYAAAVKEDAATREGVLAALQLGDMSLAKEEYAIAEEMYGRAGELASDADLMDVRARSYFGLGMAARGRQDWDEAARRFMSVGILFDDPELTPEALYRAALAFGQVGKSSERSRTRAELHDRYPDSEWARKLEEEKIP